DGASYALSLGLANGDLFTHVLAFSPGFAAPPRRVGAPAVYLAHGTADRVLPVSCSRRVRAELEQAGGPLRYREFAGGHQLPDDIVREALRWFAGGLERAESGPAGAEQATCGA